MRYSAAFLDRDGTIIRDRGYPDDPSRVELLPGVEVALALLNARAIPVVVVTNQSGIGRGLYEEEDFWNVEREMERRLAVRGCAVDDVRFCPHDPGREPPCACRKPGLALYQEVAEARGIRLSEALFVGDRLHDVLPALEVGGTGILLHSGGAGSEESVPEGVLRADDLREAVRMALDLDRRETDGPPERRDSGEGGDE